MKKKEEMVLALAKRNCRAESDGENVETIYFEEEHHRCCHSAKLILIAEFIKIIQLESPEITLEANPDDLSIERIVELSKVKLID
jgi:oxygen-independent coproporphyrinogen-3 oxidase